MIGSDGVNLALAKAILTYGLHLPSCPVEKAKFSELEEAFCACGLSKVRAISSEVLQ